ncbi:aldehyde dehydrogenase [Hydrogenibacillus schlegelii]|uniref:2-hydroxymuconic semialdehyde dehydrogenase n=1 Tax=Hydrogenibacillus schlegelii TaxID=1484 RepID=A0A179IR07_HYDSH|nr:aldehyde dehydrogenase [Hydrogenibacillus schlegelii]OAR04041.1 2-hydroxymuconic semialdehyde dehydrogenase [Hydrogenibacillus schlegelii]
MVQTVAQTHHARLFIDGAFVESSAGKRFVNINPATEEELGWVEEATKEDVDRAVQAARRALQGPWGRLSIPERIRLVRRIGDLILERREEFARLETLDTGKPYWVAYEHEIPRAAYNFHFFADYLHSVGTEAYQLDAGQLHYAIRRPVGVVGLITPWNLPMVLLTWKMAPALAMGNTVVVKPAELTPLSATLLAEVIKEAGIPDGVVNVVHGFGPNSAGAFLVEHPGVNAISFTGETTTGKTIMANASRNLKRLSFELGGKNPNIIFADADLDEAIDMTLRSSFHNQGEVCLCGSRIYVERPVYEEFLDRFVKRTKELVVGDPFDPKTFVGPLISREHLERVMGYVEIARNEGRILIGGKQPEGLTRGYYLEPTIVVDMPDTCRVMKEEVFGPVVTVSPFDTEEEVIARANDTEYGLSATVWTTNLKRAHRVAHQLEVGMVWINTWFLRDLRTPFGGMKQSGIGREGGMHSVEFYSELTNITVKL